jgi:hypothetical protein
MDVVVHTQMDKLVGTYVGVNVTSDNTLLMACRGMGVSAKIEWQINVRNEETRGQQGLPLRPVLEVVSRRGSSPVEEGGEAMMQAINNELDDDGSWLDGSWWLDGGWLDGWMGNTGKVNN